MPSRAACATTRLQSLKHITWTTTDSIRGKQLLHLDTRVFWRKNPLRYSDLGFLVLTGWANMYVLDESHHPQTVQAADARCQIDLIQLIGFLKFRSSTLNSDQASFKQVVFPSAERTTINIFAGGEQADVFLRVFRISDQLVEQLELTEVVQKLVLEPQKLKSLVTPLLRVQFLLSEGQRFRYGDLVCKTKSASRTRYKGGSWRPVHHRNRHAFTAPTGQHC